MNISSLLQSSSIYSTGSVSGTTKTQNAQSLAELLRTVSSETDTASISEEGMALSKSPPPKPPQKIDFENMTDEDLTSFLEKMQSETGSIPGVEEGTSVSELTSEQLQEIREQLYAMAEEMEGMRGMGRMKGPPPAPPEEIESMSDDALTSLLEKIQEETGSIPGIEDSESTDVSSLTSEQLQSAREALVEMMQQRMEEMMQSKTMSHAISAYETSGSLEL